MTARTVTLPVNPGASWALAWGETHDVQDDETYSVDATAWLGSDTLNGADVYRSTDAAMTVYPATVSGGIASVRIVGGTGGSTAEIAFRLHHTGGVKLVEVSLVVTDLSAGLVPVGMAHTADNSNSRADSITLTADAA